MSWPARFVGAATAIVDDAGRALLVRHTLERDELARPISDFTVRRIDDALAGNAPDAVVTIERLGWVE